MESTHVYASVHRQGSTQGVHAATWIPSTQVTDVRSDLDFRGEDEVVDDLDRSAAQHRHADRQAEEVEEIEGSQVPTPQHGTASICCMPRTADTQRRQHCMLAWAAAGPDTARCIQGHPATMQAYPHPPPHMRCIR